MLEIVNTSIVVCEYAKAPSMNRITKGARISMYFKNVFASKSNRLGFNPVKYTSTDSVIAKALAKIRIDKPKLVIVASENKKEIINNPKPLIPPIISDSVVFDKQIFLGFSGRLKYFFESSNSANQL